jgi:hypothetical protein
VIKNSGDNLFGALFTYCPRVDREPLEDFCTEGLAWCLRNSATLSQEFLRLNGLKQWRHFDGAVTIDTQSCFELAADNGCGAEAAGRVDLLIQPQVGEAFVMLIESKVVPGQNVFERGQLEKYRRYLNTAFAHIPSERRFLVTLTPTQQKMESIDASLRWDSVQNLVASFSGDEGFTSTVLKHFSDFLETKGLAPMILPRFTPEFCSQWSEVKETEDSLCKLLETLRAQLPDIVRGRQVNRRDKHWLGIAGEHDFWAGFCCKQAEAYMWVEITVPGDRRVAKKPFSPELAADFEKARDYLERHWNDRAAVNCGNLTKTGTVDFSRFVFARPLNEKVNGKPDTLSEWLHGTSLDAIRLLQKK